VYTANGKARLGNQFDITSGIGVSAFVPDAAFNSSVTIGNAGVDFSLGDGCPNILRTNISAIPKHLAQYFTILPKPLLPRASPHTYL
jgi:hypothetical protein